MSSIPPCCLAFGTSWTRLDHIVESHPNYLRKCHNIPPDAALTPFRCVCGEKTINKKEMIKHFKTCKEKTTTFLCGYCSEIETTKPKGLSAGGLLIHLLTEHKISLIGLECPVEECDVLSSTRQNLSQHLSSTKRHKWDKAKSVKVASEVHEATFPRSVDGKAVATRLKSYRCPCGETDFRKDKSLPLPTDGKSIPGQHRNAYNAHIRKCPVAIRLGLKASTVTCDLCGKKVSSTANLKHHKVKKHGAKYVRREKKLPVKKRKIVRKPAVVEDSKVDTFDKLLDDI